MWLWFTKAATNLLTEKIFCPAVRPPNRPERRKGFARLCIRKEKSRRQRDKDTLPHRGNGGVITIIVDSVLDERQRIQRGGLWLKILTLTKINSSLE